MPEYLAPGVFIEEVSFRSKSIEGVGTSVTAIVGPTRTGPLRGRPEVVTSFAQFTRVYGDARDLTFANPTQDVLNHTAIAARAYFENGGKQLFVVRVARQVNETDRDGATNLPGAPAFASATDPNNRVTFRGRFPGAAGNYWLELRWRDSDNLLITQRPTALEEDEIGFLEATGLPLGARAVGITNAAVPPARFPIAFRGLVRRSGDRYVIIGNRAEITANVGVLSAGQLAPPPPAGQPVDPNAEGVLMAAAVVNGGPVRVTFTRISARRSGTSPLVEGTAAELRFSDETNLSTFTGAPHWGRLRTLRGTLIGVTNGVASQFRVQAGGLNTGVANPIDLPLTLLAAAPTSAAVVMLREGFDLDVRARGVGDRVGEVVYSFSNCSTDPAAPRALPAMMPARPVRRDDQLTQPVSCSLSAGVTRDQVLAALDSLFDSRYLNPTPPSVDGTRYLISMTGGADGEVPVAADYGGETHEVDGSTGLAALEDIEDVSIVMTPAAAAHPASHQGVVNALWAHCQRMRYRVGIVDSQDGMSLSEVRTWASQFPDSRLALYYPWVVTTDPTGLRDQITVPPGGFIAGVYANTDVNRGVHKAPANEPILGALRLAQEINRFQQELLNPNGVNCLRSFPGGGNRVWGGRTLEVRDPEWKYVNVRRYFLFLERSIDKSTQWVVFEPNGERLWANVRSSVEDFLYNEWFNGRLLGGSPKEAYFVRCDRSTMTQNDLDNGRLVCLVGVAPLKPAEFVIFRIGQKTSDAQG